ncbi:MAG: DUF6387 family protein [Methylococcaceae bacterium]
MTKLETSWFDLKKYRVLNKFDLKQWYQQLSIRSDMKYRLDDVEEFAERIKQNPIIDNFDEQEWESHYLNKLVRPSVMGTPAHVLIDAFNNEKLNAVLARLKSGDEIYFDEDAPLISDTMPYDEICNLYEIETYGFANVLVDLMASDEQIKSDFNQWLVAQRKKTTGYKPSKKNFRKNFTDANLAEWAQYKLLPYIDLMFIKSLEQKEIMQTEIAELIFADEYDVDIIDRLRRSTQLKAEWLMRNETLSAIASQLSHQIQP